MNGGWIKLHRKIFEWEWYDDPNTCRLFIHLILKANHKDGKWRGVEVERGQTLTSQQHLADEIGLSRMQIRTALSKLESTSDITNETTNQYSLITVNNYDAYQQDNQRITNEQPADNQRVTTNNNNKNNKNNKKGRESTPPVKKNKYSSLKDIDSNLLERIAQDYDVPLSFVDNTFENMELWCKSKGKRYKDYNMALRNWVKRDMADWKLKARRMKKSGRGGVAYVED